jgi:hypothetical protein
MKIIRSAGCALLCAVTVVLGSDFVLLDQGVMDRESLESFLRSADVVSIDRGSGRRTESWQIELREDGIRRGGFFKLTDRQRPHPSGGDSYKYVIAAYELDKMLELNLVPPTVERRIKGEKGSLMLFLDNVISESERVQKEIEPLDPEMFKREMAAVNVFEHLIYFPCLCNQTDPDNILIQTDNDWKIWMVDLSTAFMDAPRLIKDCPLESCPKDLFENLIDLDEKKVKTRLKAYLLEDELNALLIRKDLIIERIKALIEEKGEESVLHLKK